MHTHTYINTYIHTLIHTNIHTHIRTYVRSYIHTYIHTYVRTYINTHTHTHTGMSRESEQLSSNLDVLANAVGRLAEPSSLTLQRLPHATPHAHRHVTPDAQGSAVRLSAWDSRPHAACDTERTPQRYLDATPLCFSPEWVTPPERLGVSALAGLSWQAASQARR